LYRDASNLKVKQHRITDGANGSSHQAVSWTIRLPLIARPLHIIGMYVSPSEGGIEEFFHTLTQQDHYSADPVTPDQPPARKYQCDSVPRKSQRNYCVSPASHSTENHWNNRISRQIGPDRTFDTKKTAKKTARQWTLLVSRQTHCSKTDIDTNTEK